MVVLGEGINSVWNLDGVFLNKGSFDKRKIAVQEWRLFIEGEIQKIPPFLSSP